MVKLKQYNRNSRRERALKVREKNLKYWQNKLANKKNTPEQAKEYSRKISIAESDIKNTKGNLGSWKF